MKASPKFLIDGCYGCGFDNYEEAEICAKRTAEEDRSDKIIYQAIAQVKFPVPDYEVVKF